MCENMKVKCGAIDCVYNNLDCYCEHDEIRLSDCYYQTVNEGTQHFWRCKNYEESEWAKSLAEKFLKDIEKKYGQ